LGFSEEIEMKVVSSPYVGIEDGTHRSGFYLDIVDSTGRRIAMGITSSGVRLNTDRTLSDTNGIPFVSFNTTDAFHRYKVVADAVNIQLFIDDVLRGTIPLDVPRFLSTDRSQ